MWDSGSNRDRADVHITVVDPPAFLVGVGVAAAGKSGHAPLKRESLPADSSQDSFSAVAGVGSLPGKDAPAAFPESWPGLPKRNFRFSPRCLTDLASIARE
jgi:hypothetical protein